MKTERTLHARHRVQGALQRHVSNMCHDWAECDRTGLCRYVSGDYRFRNGYCRSNPRKMVKMWAEKEFRNLNRLQQAGIPSPKPAILRQHVLVMEFIGTEGVAAPRLKVRCGVLHLTCVLPWEEIPRVPCKLIMPHSRHTLQLAKSCTGPSTRVSQSDF